MIQYPTWLQVFVLASLTLPEVSVGFLKGHSRHLCVVDPHSKHLGSLFERLVGLSSLDGSVGGALSVL